jgi:glycosyltransferase involved in cell wall biosynthesis
MSLSIVTTVLDDETNIESCIESVKIQNIKRNFEHIIVDGGSKDSTLKILKILQKKNKYLKIFAKKKINIYEGINYGIKQAKYNHVGLLHSGDLYKNKNVLKNILKEFKKNPTIPAIYANVSIVSRINPNNEIRFFKSKKLRWNDFIKGIHPPHTSLFLKKKIFYSYGFYNENLKISSDFEFMLRVFGINKLETKHINKTLIVMRAGGTSNKNLFNIIKSNYEVYKAFKINNLKINIITIIMKIFRKLLQIKFNKLLNIKKLH